MPRDSYHAGRDMHIHHGGGVRRAVPRGKCPYPGLAPFTDELADWFYGRDRVAADLLGRLDAHLTHGGPIMVVAPSGAGKSSLLRAGLLHRIAEGRLPAAGSQEWPRIMFTPGAHPLREAAAALKAALRDEPVHPDDRPPTPDDLDNLLRRLVSGPGDRVVIVVDQFEELFTLCDSEPERKAFIRWLWRAAGSEDPQQGRVLAVCGIRADFYAQCVSGYPELRRSLQADQVVLGPMSREELEQAIRFPAEDAGLDIEPGLTDLLLAHLRADQGQNGTGDKDSDADYDAGRLPLLAHALRATWREHHGSILTVDGYRATGGIEHAISDSAERVYASLDRAAQRATRVMFLRLVKVGTRSSEDARRLVSSTDLTSGNPAAEAALKAYTGSRLITTARDAVQITHEALLTAWPRLKGWLDDDRAADRQNIEDTAANWARSSRDPGLLYRGSRLETAARWARDHTQELTATAQEFLATSQRQARRALRIRRGGISLLTVLALIASGLALWANQQRDKANQQRNQAIASQIADEVETAQLNSTNPSLAAQLLLAAYQLDPSSPDLRERLMSTENQPLPISQTVASGSAVYSVAFSPDGKSLAAGDGNFGPGTTNGNPVGNVESDVNGKGGPGAGAVSLWSASSLSGTRALNRPIKTSDGSPAYSVAFSPNGRTLAVGDGYEETTNTKKPLGPADTGVGQVNLWDVSNRGSLRALGRPIETKDGSVVTSVAFSPNGRTLAVGDQGLSGAGAGEVTLWSISGPGAPEMLSQPVKTSDGGAVTSIAFSPDGSTLAVGDDNGGGGAGEVNLWDVSSRGDLRPFGTAMKTKDGGAVTSIAFAPNDACCTLAVGDNNSNSGAGEVSLWDISSPDSPSALFELETSDGGAVYSVAFSPDGSTLAVGDAGGHGSGEVNLWDITDPQNLQGIGQPLKTSDGDGVYSVAFSPDGRTLAVGDAGGALTRWTFPSITLPTDSQQPPAEVDALAFSPNGHTLTDGGISDLNLWAVSGQDTLRRLGQPAQPIDGSSVTSLAFSPDGRTLAVGDDGDESSSDNGTGEVSLWAVSSQGRLRLLGRPVKTDNNDRTYANASANSVAFSPNGRILAVGTDEGFPAHGLSGAGVSKVSLWTVSGRNGLRPLGPPVKTGDNGTAYSVAFSPDGRILAVGDGNSGGGDGKMRLFAISPQGRLRALGKPLVASNDGAVHSVAFSPDGHILAAGASNGAGGSAGLGEVSLWDISSPGSPHALGQALKASDDNTVTSLAFSPDSRTLAVGDGDDEGTSSTGEASLWDVTSPGNPRVLGLPLKTRDGGAVNSVAFSPDGRTLVIGGQDGYTEAWHTNVSYSANRICRTGHGVLTSQQWKQYVPQLPYNPPCPSGQ